MKRSEVRQRIHAHTTPMSIEGLPGLHAGKNFKLTSPDGKVHLGVAGDLFPFLFPGAIANVSITIMMVTVEEVSEEPQLLLPKAN